MRASRRSWGRRYCALAGALDVTTGLALIAAPALVLDWMRVPQPADSVFVRFLGAFVLGVGASYWWPFATRHAERVAFRLSAVVQITALVRMSVGLFVTGAILGGALPLPWVSVAITDLALSASQILMIRNGVFTDGR